MTPEHAEAKFYYDVEAADRAVRFFKERLTHFEGRFAGKPFIPLPWEEQILRDVYGTKRRMDGLRRYREVYLELPRKNGKSMFVGGNALYLLSADNEQAGQVVSVARTTEQSSICFAAAKAMVRANASLSRRIDLKRWFLFHPRTQSIYRALSGENVGSHGKNLHGILIDEFHEWTTPGSRELFEALATARGARTQPLIFIITTAGNTSDNSLCLEYHKKAMAQAAGDCDDEQFYSVVYTTNKRWDDESGWAEANPSLGHTVTMDYLRGEAAKAKKSVRYQNSFRRLYLDQWTEAATRWLNMEHWDQCQAPFEIPDRPPFVGLDLSTSYDFAGMPYVWDVDGCWLVLPKLFIPEETARKRWIEDNTPVPEWIEQGFVIATPRPTIDYGQIGDELMRQHGLTGIKELAFDPYNANAIVTRAEQAGIITIPVYQTFRGMSAACKQFEGRLLAKTVKIYPNPAMRWMAQNVEVEQDRHANIRPVKPRQSGAYAGTRAASIDGIVATLTAVARMIMGQTDDESDDEEIPMGFT